jgi:hypothetical protein
MLIYKTDLDKASSMFCQVKLAAKQAKIKTPTRTVSIGVREVLQKLPRMAAYVWTTSGAKGLFPGTKKERPKS